MRRVTLFAMKSAALSTARAISVSRPYRLLSTKPASSRKLIQDPTVPVREMTSEDFRSRLALIDACLKTSQARRAEILFEQLCSREPALAAKVVDVHVFNSFLDGFVNGGSAVSGVQAKPQLRNALLWLTRMKRSGVRPIPASYALILKAAIYHKKQDIVRILFEDLRRQCGPGSDRELWRCGILSDGEGSRIRDILSQSSYVQHVQPKQEIPVVRPEDMPELKMPTGQETESAASFARVRSSNAPNLYYVKQSLTPLGATLPLFDKQISLEQESFRMELERLLSVSDMKKEKTGLGFLPAEMRIIAQNWHVRLTAAIRAEIEKVDSIVDQNVELLEYGPFLKLFEREPEKLSVLTIYQFLKHFTPGSPHAVAFHLVSNIGESVQQEFNIRMLSNKKVREQLASDFVGYSNLMKSNKFFSRTLRKLHAANRDSNALTAMSNDVQILGPWPETSRAKVGSALASLLIQEAKVPVSRDLTSQLVLFSDTNQQPNDFSDSSQIALRGEVIYEPAFMHQTVIQDGKNLGVVQYHEAVASALEKGLKGSEQSRALLFPKLLPMLVPPKPWFGWMSGGYLTIKTKCIRSTSKQQDEYVAVASRRGDLTQVLSALDVLGMTKWRVNDKLLQHVIHAWNTGEEIAGLPKEPTPIYTDLPKPEDWDTNSRAKRRWHLENKEKYQEYANLKSMRATENYKIEIARAFVGQTLYFPHNMDFRGRAYPIPPHFNHIGNDLARSLLIFDEAKPLGKNGLRWLKIHLANTYGFDKASFEDREKFVDENIDKVFASADEPFGENEKNKWWLSADKPWMTLSSCIEIASVLRSGDPELFQSHHPVHQDGSCNGLQHYAALGGDVAGAVQVNLACGIDRPQDVYMACAEKVREMVAEDLKHAPPDDEKIDTSNFNEEQLKMARDPNILGIKTVDLENPELRGRLAKLFPPEMIFRKLVKQTVMTSVYGVTNLGAMAQVRERLKEKFIKDRTFTKYEVNSLAIYLTPKIFQALHDMFSGAREIQNWLADSAREIARSVTEEDLNHYLQQKEYIKKLKAQERNNKSSAASAAVPIDSLQSAKHVNAQALPKSLNRRSTVVWTTPLGMPICQPYRKQETKIVATSLQTFSIHDRSKNSSVDVQKQRSAFPPNFIHSLDATHMLMTALACAESQDPPITFASVHDSYWTHACDVERLREVLRNQFVKLHSQPIMENLRNEMIERYKGRKVLRVYTVEEYENLIREREREAKEKYITEDIISTEKSPEEVVDETFKSPELSSVVEEGGNTSMKEIVNELISSNDQPKLKFRKRQKYVKVWENIHIPPLPKKGSFDINEVAQSSYFFS